MHNDVLAWLAELINTTLFELGGTPVNLASLIWLTVAIALSAIASRLVQGAIARAFSRRGVQAEGTIAATRRLTHYAVMLVGTSVGLQTVGVNLGALFAAGAVFAVAIGFAMQNIVQNFVSGILLLAERAIKPGDILEVEGLVVRVVQPGIRTTVVRTADEEDLIVPNANLVQSSVKNYTLRDSVYRLRAEVGVTYDSDLDATLAALTRAALTVEARLPDREPLVLLTGFGASSVDFEVSIWISDPWQRRVLKSQLLLAIWRALHEEGIVIAFPQLDVHFDEPVTRGLARAA